MNNIILLIFCFIIGMFIRRLEKFPPNTPSVLNGFIIYLSLPAITILHVHKLKIEPSLFMAAVMPWIHFVLAWLLFNFTKRFTGFSQPTLGALILTVGLGNTSFVGLPMIEAYYGTANIGTAIVVDQAGTFLVLSTLGMLVAVRYSGGSADYKLILKKMLVFPPFVALLFAFAIKSFSIPTSAEFVLQKIADTLTPLALVSVGFQIKFREFGKSIKPLFMGLGYKLLFAPAALFVLYIFVLKLNDMNTRITLFEAAMPPMITASIIAQEYGLDPDLASLLIGIGIPVSFLTLYGWSVVLQFI